VLLVTHDCGLAYCGFAYASRRPPQEICQVYNHTTFDHLAGDWFVFVSYSANDDPDC
jgi:hypothetical protein